MAPVATVEDRLSLERDPLFWRYTLFPKAVSTSSGELVPEADYHADLWEWAWRIELGVRPRPFVAIWPRGGAKSTAAEAVTVAFGARRRRRFGLYVCHETGTTIYDRDLGWMTVDDHPTATPRTGDGVEVRVVGLPGSEVVTPEHPYWARRMTRKDLGHGRGSVIDRGTGWWMEAEQLDRSTWLGLPINSTEEEPAAWPSELLSDPEWWWAVGLWWGDGTLGGPGGSQVAYALSDDHPAVADRLRRLLDRHGVRWAERRAEGRQSSLSFWHPTLAGWLASWKQGNSRKQPPEWVERLPLPLQANLLRGYVDADGWEHDRGVTLSSVHLPGLLAVRRMLARLGVYSTVDGPHRRNGGRINGRTLGWAASYNLRFGDGAPLGLRTAPTFNRLRDVWVGDGHIWSRVRSVTPVEDRTFIAITTSTHDYLTHVARSHNCDTQARADDHVQAIGALLESRGIATFYPEIATRRIGKFGHPRGWRRNRLGTSSGFTVDALGLDTAARGLKIDEARPDFMIFDDVDDLHDGSAVVAKKIRTITQTIIPAGSGDTAILFVQNLVHPDSIASQLVDGRADFMAGRLVSGPHKAVEGLEYVATGDPEQPWRITGGVATWVGQSIGKLEAEMNAIGPSAFVKEYQHEVEPPPGGMFDHLDFDDIRVEWGGWPGGPSLAALTRVVVWVDTAVTSTKQSDAQAIQADGLGADGRVYRLFSWEERSTPGKTMRRAILKGVELGAEAVGVETDQGGDLWETEYRKAAGELVTEGEITDRQVPPFRQAKAGQGHGPKTHRASLMLADYERDRFRHVLGTHSTLEAALKRFPLTAPLDLTDAAYWSWWDVTGRSELASWAPEHDPETPDAAYQRAMDDAYSADRPSSWRGR